jgi:hypothetical protein
MTRRARHKHSPCFICKLFGVESYTHQFCSNGPPPAHGPACRCEMCDGDRLDEVVFAAQDLLHHPRSIKAVARLRAALAAHEGAEALNSEHWRAQMQVVRTYLQEREQAKRSA